MTHSITLEIPEKTYRSLTEMASKAGKGIEEVAIERLSDEWPEGVVDPLDNYVGVFSSGLGTVAHNHDKHLADNLVHEMRNENS